MTGVPFSRWRTNLSLSPPGYVNPISRLFSQTHTSARRQNGIVLPLPANGLMVCIAQSASYGDLSIMRLLQFVRARKSATRMSIFDEKTDTSGLNFSKSAHHRDQPVTRISSMNARIVTGEVAHSRPITGHLPLHLFDVFVSDRRAFQRLEMRFRDRALISTRPALPTRPSGDAPDMASVG